MLYNITLLLPFSKKIILHKERQRLAVIEGDFNTKSLEWESLKEDNKRRILIELMTAHEVVIFNKKEPHTFGRSSYYLPKICLFQSLYIRNS